MVIDHSQTKPPEILRIKLVSTPFYQNGTKLKMKTTIKWNAFILKKKKKHVKQKREQNKVDRSKRICKKCILSQYMN